MVRTTLMLPLLLKRRVTRRARQRRISFGQYVREWLERSLEEEQKSTRADDPLFADDETFADDWPGDVAENHRKYLRLIFEHKHRRGAHRRRKSA